MISNIEGVRKNISQTYKKNPFHNWPHGKYVGNAVMRLEGSLHCVSPGRMAGYLHDADHQGFLQEDDEERAAQIAHNMLSSKGYSRGFIDQTKHLIMGTIFKERGSLSDLGQKLIADADLSKYGGDYLGFVSNALSFLLETNEKGEIKDDKIISFFESQPKFFNHLTDITGRKETPFLTERARIMYPHFSKNKDKLAQDIEENPGKLIDVVRELESKPDIKKWRANSGKKKK